MNSNQGDSPPSAAEFIESVSELVTSSESFGYSFHIDANSIQIPSDDQILLSAVKFHQITQQDSIVQGVLTSFTELVTQTVMTGLNCESDNAKYLVAGAAQNLSRFPALAEPLRTAGVLSALLPLVTSAQPHLQARAIAAIVCLYDGQADTNGTQSALTFSSGLPSWLRRALSELVAIGALVNAIDEFESQSGELGSAQLALLDSTTAAQLLGLDPVAIDAARRALQRTR